MIATAPASATPTAASTTPDRRRRHAARSAARRAGARLRVAVALGRRPRRVVARRERCVGPAGRSRGHRSRGEPRAVDDDGASAADARLRPVSHPSLGRPPLDLTAGLAGRRPPDPRCGRKLAARALAVGDRSRPDAARAQRRGRPAPAAARRRAPRRARGARVGDRRSGAGPRVRRLDLAGLPAQARAARRPDQPVRGPARRLPARPRGRRAARGRTRPSTRPSPQYRWHRRLAGDARKQNAFLQFIYKGG